MRIRDLGEFGLIERIAEIAGSPTGAVLGIGDDTAVLDTGGPNLLLATVDIQVEGRHFIRDETNAHTLGRRAAAINLSDIGAMGGFPRWALVSLALPRDLPVSWVEDLYRGLREELEEFNAAVIGGNLSGSDAIVIDITLLGEVERDRVVRRDGARPGDLVMVTGTLGLSGAGRMALKYDMSSRDPQINSAIVAHRLPHPRVREGRALTATGHVTAMLDVSDGLASDIGHILDASGVGAEIDLDLLPIAREVHRVASRLGVDPRALAASGGEDYELLFTVAPDGVETVRQVVQAAGAQVTVIGTVLEEGEGRWFLDGGRRTRLDATGWDHFGGDG